MATNRMAANAYRTVQIESRVANYDQHDLVTMLYEGVLDTITRAKGATLSKDVSTKVAQIGKAIRLIQEGLIATLDMERGGELAQNLSQLYNYAIIRLTEANLRNDATMLDEVSNLIKPLLDGWKGMKSNNGGGGQTTNRGSFTQVAQRSADMAASIGTKIFGNPYAHGAWAGA